MKILASALFFFYILIPSAVMAAEPIDAKVAWAHRIELTIAVDGVVESVHVNTGQKVKKGSLLVKLDSRKLEATLREAKAAVGSIKASYDEMARELERAEELYDRTVLSEHDLQVAKNNKIIALAKLETAKSNWTKAKVDLEYASLTAPFDSIILNRNVEVGQVVINNMSTKTLITLAASNKFLAKGQISSAQLSDVEIGQKVLLTVLDKKYAASIIAIKQDDKKAEYSMLVVEFTSQDTHLHVGSAGKISF